MKIKRKKFLDFLNQENIANAVTEQTEAQNEQTEKLKFFNT